MKVLIVDDERNIRESMRSYLSLEGIESEGAENGLSAQRMIKDHAYDVCLVDLRMPGLDGLSLLRWIRQEGFRMPVFIISAHGEIRDAVEALKSGAQDYIVKPFDPEELTIRLIKMVEAHNLRMLVETETRTRGDSNESTIIGESESVRKMREVIGKIAASPATVLITGESGTGKEVAAREIHRLSTIADGPFVAVNIGGVPENLLESELFGYERGAFTGASARKYGMFELASGGTLFLDEIGDMPQNLQVKLLRVLQEKRVTRLGGTTPIPIQARIIAATNRDIEEQVRTSEFREDLFYRLNVVRIELPPLRDRTGDIPLLAAGIIRRLNRAMGTRIEGITPEGIALMQNYRFPGNIRELENTLERAVLFTSGPLIGAEDLELRGVVKRDQDIGPSTAYTETPDALNQIGVDSGEPMTLKEMERIMIIRALRRWEGNRTRAAEELGISRRTLINKIAELSLDL